MVLVRPQRCISALLGSKRRLIREPFQASIRTRPPLRRYGAELIDAAASDPSHCVSLVPLEMTVRTVLYYGPVYSTHRSGVRQHGRAPCPPRRSGGNNGDGGRARRISEWTGLYDVCGCLAHGPSCNSSSHAHSNSHVPRRIVIARMRKPSTRGARRRRCLTRATGTPAGFASATTKATAGRIPRRRATRGKRACTAKTPCNAQPKRLGRDSAPGAEESLFFLGPMRVIGGAHKARAAPGRCSVSETR